jgi:uncharacterized protein (DUF4415 family)
VTKNHDFRGGKRGPILSVAKGKTRVTIRLDEDVVEWFREQWMPRAAATIRA